MATVPADRTKLALAQSNQNPLNVLGSSQNKNALAEAYDTIDLLNQKVDANYGTGAISTNQLADSSVTLAKMADSSVGTMELVAASVTLAKMAAASVGTTQLVDGSVTDAKIAPATITADKFVAGALNNDTQNGLLITALSADITQVRINVKYPPSPLVAVKGDNIIDDTAALQAIIDYVVSAGGGVIYFPKGTYKTTATLTCTSSNVKFIGHDAIIMFNGGSGDQALYIYGSLAATKNITVAIAAGANTFTVSPTDSLSFNVGDYVKLVTDENYFIIASRDYKKGEMVRVLSVNNTTGVITINGSGIVLPYSITGHTPTAQLINFIDNIEIQGIYFKGTGTDNGQVGLQLDFVKNSTIEKNECSDLEVGVSITSCFLSNIANNKIHDCNHSTTGYGIEIGGVSQGIEIHHNKFDNNRHSVTTTGYDGVVMHVNVSYNEVFRCLNAGLNAHGNARYVKFSYNHVDHCLLGISSYAPCTSMIHNTITNTYSFALYFIEAAFINAIVKDNVVDFMQTGDFITISNTGASAYETNEYIIIEGNIVNNAANATGISIGVGTSAVIVSIRNNDLNTIGYKGINVAEGEKIMISGNNLYYSTRGGSAGNDGITVACSAGVAVYGSILQITNNNVYRFYTAIVVTAADAMIIEGNITQAAVNYAISGVTNMRTGSNYPDIYKGSLVWNPASLVDGAGETSANITVTGAVVTDRVEVYPPYTPQGMLVYGYVSAADTVNIRIQNETGGTIDLASGTWKVAVKK